MNAQRLTDAQISQALRARIPERAQSGLRDRILQLAEATPQQRELPSFLGALSDADPVTRRRSLLIAAALALALAATAAVGALRLLERDPIQDLSFAPPADLQEYVIFSYDRMPELPPVAITTLDSDGSKGRIYVDRSGAIRIERYASADATEPETSMILSGNRFGRTVIVGPDTVWVEQDEAIGQDPRVYLPGLSGLGTGGECESTEDPDDVGNATAATGWRYVGVEDVAGRPAHHVACDGDGDLWFDIETQLVLRSRSPILDDAERPIPGAFSGIEVTEIEFAEQPAALFAFVPPDGVAAMSIEAYLELCGPGQAAFGEGPPCSGTPRPPEDTPPPPSPTPDVSPSPLPSDCAVRPGPSQPTGPLTWTQASLTEDWPAPVRPEPAGGAIVQVIPAKLDVHGQPRDEYIDPSGDTGSDCHPWVDIQELSGPSGFGLASNQPPVVDPSEQWIAYGVVFDEDRDGVPDWRFGIDKSVDATGGPLNHRAWGTDLHTGRVILGWSQGSIVDSYYPPEGFRSDAQWSFGGDVAGGGTSSDRPSGNYYLWASVIENGRVVATDYAPDLGWLDPSLLGKGQNRAGPFGASDGNGNGVCVDPPQRGCRETDWDLGISIYFTVPDGWTLNESEGALTKRDTGTVAPSGMGLHFRRGGWLYSQPCRNANGPPDIRVGPTPSDFADALAANPLLDVTTPVRVTLGGHSGWYVDLQLPSDISDCTVGYDPWGPAFSGPGGNQRWHVWSLNIDDVRVVIVSVDFPGTSAQDLAEMRAIIESIQFNQ